MVEDFIVVVAIGYEAIMLEEPLEEMIEVEDSNAVEELEELDFAAEVLDMAELEVEEGVCELTVSPPHLPKSDWQPKKRQ